MIHFARTFYKKKIFAQEHSNKINVVIAAFVTCIARLKLFDELDKLGERVLYYDTDSIIFVTDQDRAAAEADQAQGAAAQARVLDEYYIPKTGSFLGELTNELQQDEFIIEFASGGLKNYAFLTNKNKI